MKLPDEGAGTLELVNLYVAALHEFVKNPANPDAMCAVFFLAGCVGGDALRNDRLVKERDDRIAQLEHTLSMLIEKKGTSG